ncbi:MAG: hypothetical protein QOF01_4746 [Thermomicrobiales bacterium]|jgi:hypothetical protein|nr:hypothetical protein [Thermomicrobiales bacterium]
MGTTNEATATGHYDARRCRPCQRPWYPKREQTIKDPYAVNKSSSAVIGPT